MHTQFTKMQFYYCNLFTFNQSPPSNLTKNYQIVVFAHSTNTIRAQKYLQLLSAITTSTRVT